MIIVTLVHQQEPIIEIIEKSQEKGVSFKFVKKQGMKLYFETDAEDKQVASRIIKDLIKGSPWGAGLFFQVTVA